MFGYKNSQNLLILCSRRYFGSVNDSRSDTEERPHKGQKCDLSTLKPLFFVLTINMAMLSKVVP